MPLPNSKDPGKTIAVLNKEKPDMSRKQKVAIALSQARKSGAHIPEPPHDKKLARIKQKAKEY